jgi:hypothetical protein
MSWLIKNGIFPPLFLQISFQYSGLPQLLSQKYRSVNAITIGEWYSLYRTIVTPGKKIDDNHFSAMQLLHCRKE